MRRPIPMNRTSTALTGSRCRYWLREGVRQADLVARADRVGQEAIAGRVVGVGAAAEGPAVQVVLRRAAAETARTVKFLPNLGRVGLICTVDALCKSHYGWRLSQDRG